MDDLDNTPAGRRTVEPWERTIDEMREIAQRHRDEGWDAVAVQAGDVAPEPPSVGNSDRFGLVYTVPNAVAEDVSSVLAGDIDSYAVHRRQLGSTVFFVTEITESAARRVLLLAGGVDARNAEDLAATARERGEMYTHVQLLDWTKLGSVRHDNPSAFFPEES